MSLFRGLLAFLGRLMLVSIFLLSAVGHLIPPHYEETVTLMKLHNFPYPDYFLPCAIVVLVVGGVSVLAGYKARFGALLLLIFLVLATYYFHNFWDIPLPEKAQLELTQFMKNLSIGGAMLFIIAVGAGPCSVDARSTDTTA